MFRKHKGKFFAVIISVAYLLSVIFLALGIITFTNNRTIYFDNIHFRSAEVKLGGTARLDKTYSYGGNSLKFTRLTMYDDNLLAWVSMQSGTQSSEINYYLSNGKMEIQYILSGENAYTCDFCVQDNNIVPTAESTQNLTEIEIGLAKAFLPIANYTFNVVLDQYTTIEKIIIEYDNYINKLSAIRISMFTCFGILFAGETAVLILTITKKKNHDKAEAPNNDTELNKENETPF